MACLASRLREAYGQPSRLQFFFFFFFLNDDQHREEVRANAFTSELIIIERRGRSFRIEVGRTSGLLEKRQRIKGMNVAQG